MIKFKNVSKVYNSHTALSDINIHIEAQEFVSIVGRSGAGKTTLGKLLIAEEKLSSGNLMVSGWDISDIRHSEVPYLRRQIGVIFQDFKLLPKKTIFENIAFAMEVCGEKQKRIKELVPQLLKLVGLDDKWDRYPRQLSGGEQQKVSIARALIHHPKIILADEPTGDLDSINAHEIINLLLRINELGTTIILISHNREIVNTIKKRVITLDQGIIVSDQAMGKYLI